jgi:hypothetical protein
MKKKIHGNRYEPQVALKDKVYPKMYYKHQLGSVVGMKLHKKPK